MVQSLGFLGFRVRVWAESSRLSGSIYGVGFRFFVFRIWGLDSGLGPVILPKRLSPLTAQTRSGQAVMSMLDAVTRLADGVLGKGLVEAVGLLG